MIPDFQLTEGERNTTLWLRLRKHMQERLAVARASNDNPALDAQATAALRGEIAVLKRLIALGDDRPFIDTSFTVI